MIRAVVLRLGLSGKTETFLCSTLDLDLGDLCIVSDDRGLHYGKVIERPAIMEHGCAEDCGPEVVRRVNEDDLKILERNKKDVRSIYDMCRRKIEQQHLAMKLVDVEYTFDRMKVVCYFVAEGRVDFRKLVTDLAKLVRLRIELRQIGARDEARLRGGFGRCGRELCCSTHLRTFSSVAIQMAKTQQMSITPTSVSGVCGKLMCCLAYEYEAYQDLVKTMYPKGTHLELEEGLATVIETHALQQTFTVELWDTGGVREIALSQIKKVLDKTSMNRE